MKLKTIFTLIAIWTFAWPTAAGAGQEESTVLDTMIVTDSVKNTKLLDPPQDGRYIGIGGAVTF